MTFVGFWVILLNCRKHEKAYLLIYIHNSSYSNLHITVIQSHSHTTSYQSHIWWPVDWEWDYVPTEMCLEVPKMEYRMTGMKDE